ncbi:MAG: SDR family oxidoreductase [Pseudomonadota bacterium]
MDLELSNKTALVTGAHRGTGNIIARHLAAEGATVWVHGFDAEQAESAAGDIPGGRPVAGDLTTDAGAAAVLETIADASPEILVNNYGTGDRGDWDSADTEAWLRAYQHNVLSAQRLIRGLLPAMRARNWARIINLGTVGSTRPNAVMPHYYAAKGALATLTVSLAKEVAGTGIRVNLVSPGMILTPEVEAMYLKRGRERGWGDTWEEIEPHVARDIPIGRISRREEVADLVCFLASPRADALHAQNVRIDGGALDIVS